MSQNLVIPNKDNRVVFVFTGVDLTAATDIVVEFGSEVYSITADPLLVVAISTTELSLNLSGTSEVGKVFATVTYFDSGSVNGTDITSQSLGNSDQIVVAIGTQLIIEDGSIVTNANSFVTDSELLSYANVRGIALPATQPDREALLASAIDYLFSKENLMKGCRVSDIQELPYPRRGVCVNGFDVTNTTIPLNLKKAQIELAIQANTSDILISTTTENLTSFEVVGAYKESYSTAGAWSQVRTDKADAYLDSLLNNNGNNNQMTRF